MKLEKDKHLIFRALNYWANHIETGDISLSAQYAEKMGFRGIVKGLDVDQMRMVARIRDLASKELNREE